MGRVAGKTALVMGAGCIGEGWGNGKAISVLLAREGANVFAVDYNLESAEATCAIVEGEGHVCQAFRADVTRAGDVEVAVATCVERFGTIDILVNNVGIVETGGPVDLAEAGWNRAMDTNVTGMFLACKYALPVMEKKGGSIVNISSIAGERWLGVHYVSYGASKAAVNQLTKYVAMEYARRRVRVNAVAPGLMNTPMIYQPFAEAYGGDVDAMVRKRDSLTPMGVMGDAWDVAYAVLYLASDEAKYVTGTTLTVDGGLTCQVTSVTG